MGSWSVFFTVPCQIIPRHRFCMCHEDLNKGHSQEARSTSRLVASQVSFYQFLLVRQHRNKGPANEQKLCPFISHFSHLLYESLESEQVGFAGGEVLHHVSVGAAVQGDGLDVLVCDAGLPWRTQCARPGQRPVSVSQRRRAVERRRPPRRLQTWTSTANTTKHLSNSCCVRR